MAVAASRLASSPRVRGQALGHSSIRSHGYSDLQPETWWVGLSAATARLR